MITVKPFLPNKYMFSLNTKAIKGKKGISSHFTFPKKILSSSACADGSNHGVLKHIWELLYRSG